MTLSSFGARGPSLNQPDPSQPLVIGGHGDSIMDRFANAPVNWASSSWINLAAAISQGRLLLAYNGGIAGQTSAQVLARLGPDIIATQKKGVKVGAWVYSERINDQPSVPLVDTMNNYLEAARIMQMLGVRPLMVLTTPINSFDFRADNIALSAFLTSRGIPCFDPMTMTPLATSTGALNPIYDRGDGVHPNDAGLLTMAQAFVTWCDCQNRAQDFLPISASGGGNLIANSLFTGAATAGLPNDWADAGFGGATCTYSVTPTTAQGFYGNRFRMTKTDAGNTTKDIFKDVIASVTPTRLYSLAFVFSAAPGALTYKVVFTWKTSGNAAISTFSPVLDWTLPLTDAVLSYDAVAPATAAKLTCELLLTGTGTGWFEIGQLVGRDLTTLGGINVTAGP